MSRDGQGPGTGHEDRRLFWDGGRQAPAGWSALGRNSAAELVAEGLSQITGSVTHLYLGPALGELASWDLVDVLVECRRVLRVGGVIRVAALDFDAAVAAYAAGDADYFWDHSWHSLAGRMTSHALSWGAGRSLLSTALLQEVLHRAGFAAVRVEAFGTSSVDPALAEPDRFERYCCHVEARNATAWPAVTGAGRPNGVHLAWADPGCDSVDVLWSAPPESEGAIRYRRIGEERWTTVPATSWPTIDGTHSPYVFRSTCGVLQRGGDYEYEVTQHVDGVLHVSPQWSFSALPGDERTPIRFAFLADTGIADRVDGLSDGTRRVVGEVRDAAPHFVLAGGDYAYKSTDSRLRSGQEAVRAWLQEMEPLATGRPLMLQYGNHEVGLGERHRDWAVHFPQLRTALTGRARSYSFDAGPCHVAALYAPTEDIAADEATWLWEDLQAAQEGGSRWLVVFQHQPLLAHGSSHPTDGRVERALARVLQHHRVDLHLSAHDQNYERTHPVTWAGDGAARPSVSSDPGSPSRYPQGAGVILAKVSPSGKRSDRGRDFSALPRRLPPVVAVADDAAHHFAVVDVDDSRLELAVYALRSPGVALERIDQVVIEPRGATRPPPGRPTRQLPEPMS